jgi:hypothetical protein
MTTTDVLLVVTIVLLLTATGINMKGGTKKYPVSCTKYLPRPCSSDFQGNYDPTASIKSQENFAASMNWDGTYIEDNDVDELRDHPKGRGLVPKSIHQKNNTQNYWKVRTSQPGADDLGRRHTRFSSDLMTPYKNQHDLRKVNPQLREVKPAPVGSTVFEKFSVHPYEDSQEYNNPLENEKIPPSMDRVFV